MHGQCDARPTVTSVAQLTWVTNHLSTPEGWKVDLAWLADL